MQQEQPAETAIMVDLDSSSELDATKDKRKRVCENMDPKDKTKMFKKANTEEMVPANSIEEAVGSLSKDTASASMLQNMDRSQMLLDSFAVQTLGFMFNQITESAASQDPTETLLKNVGNVIKKMNNDKFLKAIKTAQKHYAEVTQIMEVMFSSIKQVLELPRNLYQHPQWFIKLLLNSDLADGSFLDLPKELRNERLPMHKESLSVAVILLVDEHDQEYKMDYSFTAHKLQGNWRDLYLTHRLSWGDALVFHQIGKCKFKVHIVRRRIDCTIGNSNLEILEYTREAGTSCDFSPTQHQLVRCNTSTSAAVPTYTHDLVTDLDFKNVKCFEDFKIYMNGEILNSKLPEPARWKYYELCSGQKQFLHKNIKGLNSELVLGMILQTITIVDAMKIANISTSHNLECMGKNLKSFEDLGLEIGFLCDTLDKLVKLSREHQFASESKRLKLTEVEEQERALGEEVPKLDELIKSVAARKSMVGSLGVEVETLEKERKELDQAFKEVTDSAW